MRLCRLRTGQSPGPLSADVLVINTSAETSLSPVEALMLSKQ